MEKEAMDFSQPSNSSEWNQALSPSVLFSSGYKILEINELLSGNKSGIRLDADPDFEDLNCTLVFKTAKLRNEFHKTLMEAYEQLTPPSNRGHSWLLSSFSDPTKCSVCDHLLWGSVSQGYVCQHSGCTVMCHQMCLNASELSVCRCVYEFFYFEINET